ncbi:hypothetical protein EU803_15985 [Loktanella sp. IMCC34160]|uniref:hypothetical protein n=1 Tax=Loktanella sp. IMCC34160 TaxID=2510646 RepID=UPI00101C9654|nr:hypothetical protein [Loktanella sp. IMCC34160]RYG89654.1 hypothetical protein EU803_15985 [Loktanella sp. IMCC34160]
MQMNNVISGMMVGRIAGQGNKDAFRTGLIGAAVGGEDPMMVSVVSLLFARRQQKERPRRPLSHNTAEPGAKTQRGCDDNGKDSGQTTTEAVTAEPAEQSSGSSDGAKSKRRS